MKFSYPPYFTVTFLLLLFVTNSYAGLINPNYVYSAAGLGSPSFQFSGESKENHLDTMFTPNDAVVSNYGSVRASTFIGQTYAGGYTHSQYGIMKLYNQYIINDLTLSYIGEHPAENSIIGDVHVSYASRLVAGAPNDNSSFTMSMQLGGFGSRSKAIYGEDINTNGVWSELFTLQLGAIFNLKLNVEMLIPTIRVEGGGWLAEAENTTVLGGSPVFNLPEGYVVNSADGSIVNNFYTGPNPLADSNNGPIAEVPEPAIFWLFIISFMVLGLLKLNRYSSQ